MELGHDRIPGDLARDRLDQAEDDSGLAIDPHPDREVGPVADDLGRARMVAAQPDGRAVGRETRALDRESSGRKDVLAVARGMDERVGSVSMGKAVTGS